MSSSWNEDASHTIVVVRGQRAHERARRRVPTLPATATGSPASRWMWPIHSVVVVLPLVPVTAMNSFGKQPPAQLELAEHGQAATARRPYHGRVLRNAGTLDERPSFADGGRGVA